MASSISNAVFLGPNDIEEFKSNLLLLLHCIHTDGLKLSNVPKEYQFYYQTVPNPYRMCRKELKRNHSWFNLFQLPQFREDFMLYHLQNDAHVEYYVKARSKRNAAEMKLIAKLARYSHIKVAAQNPDLNLHAPNCACCQVTTEEPQPSSSSWVPVPAATTTDWQREGDPLSNDSVICLSTGVELTVEQGQSSSSGVVSFVDESSEAVSGMQRGDDETMNPEVTSSSASASGTAALQHEGDESMNPEFTLELVTSDLPPVAADQVEKHYMEL